MTVHLGEQDFVLTVVDVITLHGRGTAVIGSVESGVLRTGEEVEVWADQHLVTTARATFELLSRRPLDAPNICVVLGDVDKSLLSSGHVVRRNARPSPSALRSSTAQ